MSDQYWRLVADWLPFLIFIGLMIYFMKKGIGGKQAQFMDVAKQYYADHLTETRKISAALERIATALEKRD